MTQSFKEFSEIPQELADHIISFVPEYGHRLNKELHEASLDTQEISVYCDFYRYCAMSYQDHFDTVVAAYHDTALDDLKDDAIRYLKKNLREVLCRYLDCPTSISKEVLLQLGINNVDQITQIEITDLNGWLMFEKHEYRKKVIRLYSLMILRDNALIIKKEFTRSCREFSDLAVLLEIMLAVFLSRDHIFHTVIRYFPTMMESVIERIERKAAVTDGIVSSDVYTDYSSHILERLTMPKIDVGTGPVILRNIRDQLLNNFVYDYGWDSYSNNKDRFFRSVFRIITMIESLADED